MIEKLNQKVMYYMDNIRLKIGGNDKLNDSRNNVKFQCR